MEHRPRILYPDRRQLQLVPSDLESALPADHLARSVWAFVEAQDFRVLYAKVKSVENGPGAPAIDPKVFVSLWLYATLDGVGSARELTRLCTSDQAYMWICGRLGMNHTSLARFRVEQGEFFEGLLVASALALVQAGVASIDSVAVDGRKIRANAGAASFRSREALEGLQAEIKGHVEKLRNELDDQPAASVDRKLLRAKRAQEERLRRVQAAIDGMEEAEQIKARAPKASRKVDVSEGPSDVIGEPAVALELQEGGLAASEAPPETDDEGSPGGTPPTGGGSRQATKQSKANGQVKKRGKARNMSHSDAASPTGSTFPLDQSTEQALEPEAPSQAINETTSESIPAEAQTELDSSLRATQARVSTTDASANRMKTADGGFRPAYNCQSLVDANSTTIFHVSVETSGSDGPLLLPMVHGFEAAYSCTANEVLADGGYVNLKGVEALEAGDRQTRVYMPPPKPRGKGSSKRPRYQRLESDSAAIGAWRERLGTTEGQEKYKLRAQSVELVNAGYANRGLNQFRTRGKGRVKSELLLHAIVHNFQVTRRLVKGP